MKKILNYIILSIFVAFSFSANANAEEIPFYTNLNGATLSESQYNNLRTVFSEDTIATMTVEQIDLIKNETDFNVSKETRYIKTTDHYNFLGEYVDSSNVELTEEEALNDDSNNHVMPFSWKDSYSTSTKKLEMQVVTGNLASVKIVTLTNTWLSIPSMKKFDVIALRPGSSSYTIKVNKNLISGYQKADSTLINYDLESDNVKVSSSFTGKGGIGISMNILDAVQSTLVNSMTVYINTAADPFNIYGTYQHATSSTTEAESQNYTFSEEGYGKVLKFASSVKGKYDNMPGVDVSYSFGDELFG